MQRADLLLTQDQRAEMIRQLAELGDRDDIIRRLNYDFDEKPIHVSMDGEFSTAYYTLRGHRRQFHAPSKIERIRVRSGDQEILQSFSVRISYVDRDGMERVVVDVQDYVSGNPIAAAEMLQPGIEYTINISFMDWQLLDISMEVSAPQK